ncbi:ATP-binding cassette domain-containing protein [Phenylobacterium sp. LjRoot225]|uniref:ABC transporter ATP-binding protein n=1 Tax=Phenylobacterium sp. LjRoot225 TaxID=3342285 RepID=UPI003ECEF7F1
MKPALKTAPLKAWTPGPGKAPPVSISCRDLTLRFPVYGVDAKSLKKRLAAVTVGGRLGSHAGVTDVTALTRVNLELKAGDRLGLVGHNGSGKTTLLRALSGAYEPDKGQVEVQGRIAALLDLSLGVDPSATGFDNIRLRGRIAGLTSREIEARLEEIADFTGLGAFLAMPVKTYSAGMKARLAFAAATAVEADVLLMDEWIAVGDAEFQQLAHKRLLKLVERAGILVLASHDRDLLRLYCNKVMRLDGGVASPVTDIRKLDELLAA